ncbi:hypothetical protein V2G26_007051 [Clonostachys chloroleuca]
MLYALGRKDLPSVRNTDDSNLCQDFRVVLDFLVLVCAYAGLTASRNSLSDAMLCSNCKDLCGLPMPIFL